MVLNGSKALGYLNTVLGTGVVFFSLHLYHTRGEEVPLYIALAIIIAGPVEDFLVEYVNGIPSLPPEQRKSYIQIIDKSTSLAFLTFLGMAVLCSVKD
jgi:hypothetical protein